MKLHSDGRATGPRISAYGEGFVTVDGARVAGNLVVSGLGVNRDLPPGGIEVLTPSVVSDLVDRLEVEILLVGTGATQHFPAAEVFAACGARGVGIEVMSTPAACRTYNILVNEGRLVAALLLEIRG